MSTYKHTKCNLHCHLTSSAFFLQRVVGRVAGSRAPRDPRPTLVPRNPGDGHDFFTPPHDRTPTPLTYRKRYAAGLLFFDCVVRFLDFFPISYLPAANRDLSAVHPFVSDPLEC